MDSPLIKAAKAEAKRRAREQFWDGVMWALIPVPFLLTLVVEFVRSLQ